MAMVLPNDDSIGGPADQLVRGKATRFDRLVNG
jgi:hypothetical protein